MHLEFRPGIVKVRKLWATECTSTVLGFRRTEEEHAATSLFSLFSRVFPAKMVRQAPQAPLDPL